MKFTALPVRVGDAFLLRSPTGIILVDAGQNKKHIVDLLKQERLTKNHINLLVCTHYDADHINGILGVLESLDFSFDEIWLPEILGSLSYTIAENLMAILKKLRELNKESVDNLISNAKDLSKSDSLLAIPEDSLIKKVNLETVNNYINLSLRYKLPLTWVNYTFELLHHCSLPAQAMLTNIIAAITTVSSALLSGAHIRWFQYSGSLVNKHYGYGMFAMNSNETAVTIYSPDVFLQQLYLTTINVESLVFKFSRDSYPNVLFCSDSNLSFTNSSINLMDESVVTAPHHGSAHVDAAYNWITGSDLIYVRSDQSQTKRPGKGFLGKNRRYCTICRNMGPKQKVEIDYAGGTARIYGNACKC